MDIDPLRVTDINRADVQRSGNFVLYWMVANRRLTYNFALQRAVEWCVELQKPLLILEALKCDYEWASLRLLDCHSSPATQTDAAEDLPIRSRI